MNLEFLTNNHSELYFINRTGYELFQFLKCYLYIMFYTCKLVHFLHKRVKNSPLEFLT